MTLRVALFGDVPISAVSDIAAVALRHWPDSFALDATHPTCKAIGATMAFVTEGTK